MHQHQMIQTVQAKELNPEFRRLLHLRWLIWLVPTAIYAASHMHRIAPTIIFSDLMSAFNTSGASLGALGSVYFYVYALMQIPSGILADSLGPRKTITAGALVGAAGSFIFGGAPVLWLAYLGRFLVGLGMSLVFICIMKLAAEWFREHEFGTMSGLTLFGGNLGSMFATKPLYFLVVIIGWRMSFKFIALLTAVLGALTWLLVRDRPSMLGLPSFRDSGGTGIKGAGHGEKVNLRDGLRETLSNKLIWPTVIISFGMYGTLVGLKGMWLAPYLTQVYGLNRDQVSTYVLLALVAGLFGPLLFGIFSDRIRRRKLPILVFTPLYLAIWLILSFWNGGKPPLAVLPALFFLMGIFCSPMALTWACAKEVSHPSLVGLATGIANIGGFLGGAVMQFLFGYILDLKWQGVVVDGLRVYPVQAYQAAFIVSSLVIFISLFSTFFIKETYCKNVYFLTQ